MKLTIISDTHGLHRKLPHLSGEILIHCGDMFNLARSSENDIAEIDEWFGEQDFDLIVCIGGNQDRILQKRLEFTLNPFKNAIYLQDQTHSYCGVQFYGAPWTPDLPSHAFYQEAQMLKVKWSMIPSATDILITHTPPAGMLDISSRGKKLGCTYLANELDRISPKVHCFGHVHASGGSKERKQIRYVNAASVNSQFELVRAPYVMYL